MLGFSPPIRETKRFLKVEKTKIKINIVKKAPKYV
jgi:hypothetical protein